MAHDNLDLIIFTINRDFLLLEFLALFKDID